MRSTSVELNLRPISRLTAYTVFEALVTAWRFAICPTRRSPLSVKPTTLGVVRPPSLLGTICTVPPSSTATQQLVVPKSIPIIFPIALFWVINRNQGARDSKSGSFILTCGNFYHGRAQEAVADAI